MAELATIARPYARAAFMHAQGAGAFKAWGDFLDAAAVAVADDRDLVQFGDQVGIDFAHAGQRFGINTLMLLLPTKF